MRLCILIMLFIFAAAAHADGFAFGKGGHFPMLRQTGQTAVIRLERDGPTVDMYIAIDGIPPGETLTYVLPFWHKPEGFVMEEMAQDDFRNTVIRPAHEQVRRNNEIAEGAARLLLQDAVMVLGGPIFGLLFFPTFSSKGSGRPLPYAVIETAHARAELYQLDAAADLQALISASGLPEEHARTLRKYNTPYFAVMHLTGAAGEDGADESPARGSGVRYHFRHAVEDVPYTYTYPLGTGAAWPRPIVLTEVFITCDDAFTLEVEAPSLGESVPIRSFNRRVDRYTKRAMSGETTEEFDLPTLTASLLHEDCVRPSAWHRAYLSSNPDEDIRVRLAPRARPWRMAAAHAMRGWPVHVASLLALLLSYAIACAAIVRPRWIAEGQPGTFFDFAVRYAGMMVLDSSIIIGVLLAATMLLSTVITFFPGLIAMLILAAVALFMLRRKAPPKRGMFMYYLDGWLLTVSLYLLATLLLVLLASWFTATVIG